MCSRMCGTQWKHGVLIRTFLYDCHDPTCQWSKSYPGAPPPHTIVRHVESEIDGNDDMPPLIIPQHMIDAARRAREHETREVRAENHRLGRPELESERTERIASGGHANAGHAGGTHHRNGSGSGQAGSGQSSGRHGSRATTSGSGHASSGHASSSHGSGGQASGSHESGGQSSTSQSNSRRSGSSKASKLFGKRFGSKK